jgi:phytoene/squalene synthetase
MLDLTSSTRSLTSRMRQYGTSYYYATLFFPRRIQQDVITLYAFVRIPDLVVDDVDAMKTDGGKSLARQQLLDMRDVRSTAYHAQETHHQVR